MESINAEAEAIMQRPEQEEKAWVMYPTQAAIGRVYQPGLCLNRDTPYPTNLYGTFKVTIPWTGAYENYKWFGNRGQEEKFVEYWVDGEGRKVNWFYITGSYDVCPHKRSTGKVYDLRDLGDEWKGDENGQKTRSAFIKFLNDAPAERKPEVRSWQDNWETREVVRRSDPDLGMECAMGNTRGLVEWNYYKFPRPKVEWHPDFPFILGRILDDSEMEKAGPFMGRTFFYTLDEECEADYQMRKAKKARKALEDQKEAQESSRKRKAEDEARAANVNHPTSYSEDASAQDTPAPKQPETSAQKCSSSFQKTAGLIDRKQTVGLMRNAERIAMGKRPRGRPRKDSKTGESRSLEKEKFFQETKPAEAQKLAAIQEEEMQEGCNSDEGGEAL